MTFDLTSPQEASFDFIHSELTYCTISVEIKFDSALADYMELLFKGERASTVYMRFKRNIVKHSHELNKKTDNLPITELINRCMPLKP